MLKLNSLCLSLVIMVASISFPKSSSTPTPNNSPSFPLQVSTNHRYLVDQQQKPFLYHADTAWAIMTRLTKAEAQEYLEDRKNKGFTAIHMHAITKEAGGMTNREAENPFEPEEDITKPNEAYWQHVDYVLNAAKSRGLLVVMSAAWLRWGGDDTEGWRNQVDNHSARIYGRFLGKRYKSFNNLMWVLCGDSNPEEKEDAIREMANGIREYAPQQLLTCHGAPENASAVYFHNDAWLGFNLAYTYGHVYEQVIEEYNRSAPIRPLILGEGAYETEHEAGPDRIRYQAYWAMLSGAAGHAYGHGSIWKFASDWREALDADGAKQMVYLKKLFASRPWYKLVPEQTHTVLTSGYGKFGDDDYATAAITDDGSLMLTYLPTHRTVTVNLSKLKPIVTARWFDPTNGKYSTIEGSPYVNRGKQKFTPPQDNSAGDSDFVLVLNAQSPKKN
jgi:hypothetical protein